MRDRSRQHQHLGQEMAEMEERAQAEEPSGLVRISALIFGGCEILGASPKTLRSLSFLYKTEMLRGWHRRAAGTCTSSGSEDGVDPSSSAFPAAHAGPARPGAAPSPLPFCPSPDWKPGPSGRPSWAGDTGRLRAAGAEPGALSGPSSRRQITAHGAPLGPGGSPRGGRTH